MDLQLIFTAGIFLIAFLALLLTGFNSLLSAKIDPLKDSQAKLESNQEKIESNQEKIESNQEKIESNLERLESNQENLAKEIKEIKAIITGQSKV